MWKNSIETKKVQIICPTCGNQKRVDIPVSIIKERESGTTSVFIPTNLVCEHGFYAYIDKNFAVRDYLALDYSMESISVFDKLKNKFNKKFYEHTFVYEEIMEFISEDELKSMLYGAFLKNPIILSAADVEMKGLQVIFGILFRLFPNYKLLSFMQRNEYHQFAENNKKKLQGHLVYSIDSKALIKCPFSKSQAKTMESLIEILKNKEKMPEHIKLIYAKNWLDIMFRFSKHNTILQNLNKKAKKTISVLKNEYPVYSDLITEQSINLMRDRYKKLELQIEL